MHRFRQAFRGAAHYPALITLDARREYFTQQVMRMMTISVGAFVVLLFGLWLAKLVGILPLSILAPFMLVAAIGWRLSRIGYWRWVNWLPPFLFFVLALYGSLNRLPSFICFYVLAFLLSGLLVDTATMNWVMVASLIGHFGIAFFKFNLSVEELLPPLITVAGAFSGIALLQRRSVAVMAQAIAQSAVDPLTGLYNRSLFDIEVARLQKSRHPISILVLDLNSLKAINDRYGHTAGDTMLQRAARVIQSALRGDDILCRIGGDEFAVLLPQTNEEQAKKIVARLEQSVAEDNQQALQHALSLAIGVATGPRGSQIQAVFERADARMYVDKARRKESARD